jgi:hypothetical protein
MAITGILLAPSITGPFCRMAGAPDLSQMGPSVRIRLAPALSRRQTGPAGVERIEAFRELEIVTSW